MTKENCEISEESVSSFLDDKAARVEYAKDLDFEYDRKYDLVRKGVGIAIGHVRELVGKDILDAIVLTPNQQKYLNGALHEAPNVVDVSCLAFPNTYRLMGTHSSSILAIASYLNSLAALGNKAKASNLGQNDIQSQIDAALNSKH
jgi:hypothetical protein